MLDQPPDPSELKTRATQAANLLKSLAHETRLMILCHLVPGEMSVGALEAATGAPQAVVSQHLARLRGEGLVAARRDGKVVYYRLTDDRATQVLETLYKIYCA